MTLRPGPRAYYGGVKRLVSSPGLVLLGLSFALGCGGAGSGDSSTQETTATSETGAETGETGTETAETTTGGPIDATLPQSIAGSFYVNTTVYSEIPVHVAVTGGADTVSVNYEGADYPATDDDADGDWVAMVTVSATGASVLTATATNSGEEAEITAELVRGDNDIQLTDIDVVGPAHSGHVYARGDRLFIIYRDFDGPVGRAVRQELDGAGRKIGTPEALLPAGIDVARLIVDPSADHIGVMYKIPNKTPYSVHFTVLDHDLAEMVAPISLEPSAAWSGSASGDVEWDGEAYQMAYRLNDSGVAGDSRLQWNRIDASGVETGPVELAASGMGVPGENAANFSANTFINLATLGDNTAVSWVRNRYITILDTSVQKGFLTGISKAGTVLGEDVFGSPDDFTWTQAVRVNRLHDRAIVMAETTDLNSPDVPIPTVFRGFAFDDGGLATPTLDTGTVVLDEIDERNEPFMVEHPHLHGVMLWVDLRQKTLNPGAGEIELRAAPLDESLGLGAQVVFPQARFFLGSTSLRGTAQGSNVIMSWADARQGFPTSEVWIDTLWN